MGRNAMIKALEEFKDAEYTEETKSELHLALICAADDFLTTSECEDIAIAYLDMSC